MLKRAVVVACVAEQRMTQLMTDSQAAQRAHGIDEQRMAAVEGMDEAQAFGKLRPAGGLHRAAHLQSEFVKVQFPFVGFNAALQHEAAQVAVGGDVVEAVVVDSGVGQVLGHVLYRVAATKFEQLEVPHQFKTEERIAVLKAMRPLRPAPRRVDAGRGKHGRAVGRLPAAVQAQCLFCSQVNSAIHSGHQALRRTLFQQLHGRTRKMSNVLFEPFHDLGQDGIRIGVPQRAVHDFDFDGAGVSGEFNKAAQATVINDAIAHQAAPQKSIG